MADAIASAVSRALEELSTHIQRLPLASSSSSSSSTPSSGVGKAQESIQRLSRTLVWIRAGLNDAEEMEISDEFVRLWLRELQAVAYDAEDVLDEFLYGVQHFRLREHGGGFPPRSHMEEVTGAVVHDSSFSVRWHEIFAMLSNVEQRIEAINSRFDEIAKHKVAFQFEESYGPRRAETPVRQPTSSLMAETRIVGREDDLSKIREFLLDGESRGGDNIPVIAILGMGGLGKTTLAQLAYNDDEINKHFSLMAWVCVSENLDLVRLTRAMIESFFSQEACHNSELDPLQLKLKRRLMSGQKFLLVLDDVWEVENLSSDWDRLIAPLCNGCAGSRILLTTRSEKVSRITRAISTYHLPCLQDGDCLKLFSQWAFGDHDPNLYQNLMAIGRKISKRCRGLPLVARTLGGLLRSEDDEKIWNNILESDMLDIIDENQIMPILKLSYKHLPVYIKRCFRYCSMFPKDYQFDRDRLVGMWIAQGYIRAKGRRLMEDIGKDYFNDLLCRSFFQCSQRPQIFLMHDLIHDLARCVSWDECHSAEGNKVCLLPGHIRHFSIDSNSDPRCIMLSTDISMSEAIRSFLFIRSSFSLNCHIEHLNNLFIGMKHLRVLDLSDIWFLEFPDFISCLRHLRYLGLQGSKIDRLPESVGSLYHLQTLDLGASNVKCLPDSISNLHNLRHLICQGSIAYPVGIGKLTSLQTIPGFVVKRTHHGRAKLGELKDINKIRSLVIKEIDNLTDVDEAKKACLERKEYLLALDLRWDHTSHLPLPIDDQVLEALKPSAPHLEWLSISNFGGQSLPSWLGHPSFSKLTTIKLIVCQNWTCLPPLGQLPSLKCLSIWSANQVEYVGPEFFSGGFPQLETLQMKYMDRWKSWCGTQEGECPCLRELFIAKCKLLRSLPVFNLNTLEVLDIKECPQLWTSNEDQLPSSLRVLNIHGFPNLTSLPLSNLNALECLRINKCPQLQFSYETHLSSTLQVVSIHGSPCLTRWFGQYEHRQRFPHIQTLEIEDKNKHIKLLNVSSIQEARDFYLGAMQRLQTLELAWDCNADHKSFKDAEPEVLKNLRPHDNLNKLVIRGYSSSRLATWIGDPSFSNLVSVALLHCKQCEFLPALGRLPVLAELYVGGAHMLIHIGSEFFKGSCSTGSRPAFPSLRKLEFNDMPNWEEWVEMEDGYLPHLCELILKHCPMLKALPHLPPSLKELELANCHEITFPDSFDHLTSLLTFRISQVPNLPELPNLPLGLTKLSVQNVPALADLETPPSVRDLVLEDCSEVMLAASLPHLTHLTSLQISDFPELETLPLYSLRILRKLHVSNCPKLVSFECFEFPPSSDEVIEGLQALRFLERLTISDCPRLHFSANERPPFTLRSVDITNCPSLASWHDKNLRKRRRTENL